MSELLILDGNNYLRRGSQNTGVKIGNATASSFSFADLKGILQTDTTGVNAPTVETFIAGITRLGYNASDIGRWEFHFEHNERIGGDKFLHVHIAKAAAATASGSNFSATAVILHSRSHGHKNWGDNTIPASSATISKTLSCTPAFLNNIGSASHDIIEIHIAQSGGGVDLLDSDLFLPDDTLTVILTVNTIPTLSGGTSSKIFLPMCDLHREVVDFSGTRYKDTSATGSFYAA